MTACKQCDFPDHLCGCDTQPAPPPEQEPCGWQFYQNGKWHNGMEANDHRVNTEAAGIPTRNVYPGPVAQPEQEPSGWKLVPLKPTQEMLRSIEAGPVSYLAFCWKAMLSAAPTPPQRKPLTDEQYFEIGQRHGLSSFKVEQIHKEIEEAAHGIKGGHDD